MNAQAFPHHVRHRARQWTSRFAVLTLGAGLAMHPVAPAHAGFCGRDAMLVFDASSSMALPKAGPAPARIDEARRAMARVLPDIAPLRRIGLMVYGPPRMQDGRGCHGIGLEFAPRSDAAPSVNAALAGLVPDGLTPLTASVRAAAEAMAYREKPAIVVVVTDGIDTCGGEPCALGRQLASQGAHLTVHVVGFQRMRDPLEVEGASDRQDTYSNLRCLAQETGGTYVDTETVADLSTALRDVLGCMLIG